MRQFSGNYLFDGLCRLKAGQAVGASKTVELQLMPVGSGPTAFTFLIVK